MQFNLHALYMQHKFLICQQNPDRCHNAFYIPSNVWPCMGLARTHELCHMGSLTWAHMGPLTWALLFRLPGPETDDGSCRGQGLPMKIHHSREHEATGVQGSNMLCRDWLEIHMP